jgi:Flp pilus assembly protein TadD
MPARAAENCGDLKNHFGPYDYRRDKAQLVPVEHNHFDAEVENLVRGKNSTLVGDIQYTLHAFPNHHRALRSVARLVGRFPGREKVPGMAYSVPCYFDRAIRFSPDDGAVRMIYAFYLAKNGKPSEAVTQLKEAEKLVGDNANLHYNLGLAYVDLKDYDNALAHAHRAYQLGFPLPGLKNKLERAGKWRNPPAAARTPASPASAAEPMPQDGTAKATQAEASATAPAARR